MDYKRLTVRKVAVPDYPEQVTAIIKSRAPEYLPKQVRLRQRISDHIKTVDLKGADVEAVRSDPGIVSLEIAAPVPPAKGR